MYLQAPEEVATGLDLVAVVMKVLASGLDLSMLLSGTGLRVELPNLPPDVGVGTVQVGDVLSFCYLQPPHGGLPFSCLPSTDYIATPLDRPS